MDPPANSWYSVKNEALVLKEIESKLGGHLEGEVAVCRLVGRLAAGEAQGGAQGVKGWIVLDEDAADRLLLQQTADFLCTPDKSYRHRL